MLVKGKIFFPSFSRKEAAARCKTQNPEMDPKIDRSLGPPQPPERRHMTFLFFFSDWVRHKDNIGFYTRGFINPAILNCRIEYYITMAFIDRGRVTYRRNHALIQRRENQHLVPCF